MIRILSFIGDLPLITNTNRVIFKRHLNSILTQKIHGITFCNPLGLSAGYDKNGILMNIISTLDFGFYTIGSVTAKQCDGNPKPWFYRLPKTKSLVVNAGLNNDGSIVVINRLHRYNKSTIKQLPIFLSVAKTNCKDVVDVESGISDYIKTLKIARKEDKIKFIELNISCPNAYGGMPFTTPGSLDLLLKAVDDIKLIQPIFIKMPIYLPWNKFKELLNVVVQHSISGVTIANLTKDRTTVAQKDKLSNNIHGYLSGRPTWDLSNNLIRLTYLSYKDKLTIIGSGGIFSAQDAYKKIRLGASLVEIATGLMFYGPQLPSEINSGLDYMLKRDGYNNISQAVGVDASRIIND
jgi:dihydroorotate dehydrogenase (fumarate)